MDEELRSPGESQGEGQGEETAAPAKSRRRKPWLIGGILVAVLVVVAIVAVGIASGAFLGGGGKILLALKNTLDEEAAVEDGLVDSLFDLEEILGSGEYTAQIAFSVETGTMDGELRVKEAARQFSATFSRTQGSDIHFLAEIGDEWLRVSIPSLGTRQLAYNFREEKSGILVDLFGADAIARLDSDLCDLVDSEMASSGKSSRELLSEFQEGYRALEFEKAEEQEFEIDGETHLCKGYSFAIPADVLDARYGDGRADGHANVQTDVHTATQTDSQADRQEADVLDARYGDGRADGHANVQTDVHTATQTDSQADWQTDGQIATQTDSQAEWQTGGQTDGQIDDVDVSVYLYEKKLAAIFLETGQGEVRILPKGGKYRLQNGEVTLWQGDAEQTLLEWSGENFVAYRGVCMNVAGEDGTNAVGEGGSANPDSMTGILRSGSNGPEVLITKVERDGEAKEVDLRLSFQKGASFEEMAGGEELDIGNLSLEDLFGMIGSSLGSLFD